MGSENSVLKSYTLEEPPFSLPTGHSVYPAVLQDGKLASVFVYKRENKDKVNKAAKHLKTLRHPCLLRFLSCTVETDGIHLVTEHVKPLEMALESLSSAEICAGIYDVLLSLVFLHDRGSLTHNNVCLSSVFVSEDGHWKLGGMETVCTLSEATPEFLRSIESVRDTSGIPPEELSADFQILPESQGHARDAYSFGAMVENLLTLLNDEDVPPSFLDTLRCTLLNPDPKGRSPLSSLLSHEFFRNDFLEVVNFLKSLTLKTEEEKTEFFKFLLDRVAGLSEELIASRLVPLLLNQLVFAEPVAVKSFLPHLLGPKKDKIGESQATRLLSPAVFQACVIPVLLKLFEVHEEHVRMVLLSHLDAYAELFSQEELKNIILPQVLLGLRDTSDSLVAVTLHSLAVLVSLLGPDVVVGGERTKIFKRSAPSFTKTTDLSPEDSSAYIVSCPRSQNSSSSMFPKCPTSGNTPLSKKHVPRRDSWMALNTGEQDSPLSRNGVPGRINPLENSRTCLNASDKPAEEWPDWSESEETETGRTVNLEIQRREPYASTGLSSADRNMDEEPWDNTEPGSPKFCSGNSLKTSSTDAITGQQLLLGALNLHKESKTPTQDSPAVSRPASSWNYPEQLGEIPSLTKVSPKGVSEFGLGEEFTIQVKRKLLPDPELDWFADMVPVIKPASALLILPDESTEPVAPSNFGTASSRGNFMQIVQFSSKFAAPEADTAGWSEEEELNWEDDGNC
uniref:SCY1 like pseudokinase 3 n=1 Tax=Sphenodon punctatus TaxID=8508 RepID=A0A8D0HCT1_SPHPU